MVVPATAPAITSASGSWLADAASMQTVMEVQALEPWCRDAGDVAAGQGVDVRQGLTSEEAAARVDRYGRNELESEAAVPAWRRLLAQFADPLIYLLFAAVVVSIVAWIVEGADGLPFDAIVITAIVLVNGVLGYVQEARAEEAVAALQRMAAATAGVRRDGRARRVPATELVPGDVLLLAEGDAVSADARLVEAASLLVAEASLSGESEAVLKQVAPLPQPAALGDWVNMVFSGTAVTRGRHRVAAALAKAALEPRRHDLPGPVAVHRERRLSPARDHHGARPAVEQQLGRSSQPRPVHRALHVLGQLPVVDLHYVRAALEGAVEPGRRQIDQHRHAVGSRVGDQVGVDLERQRIPGPRVAHRES